MGYKLDQNKITRLFKNKREGVLNIYFTAGYPKLEDTVPIINELAKAGADIIELGIPYSDPLADGLTIQESSQVALANGISLEKVFDQVSKMESTQKVAIVMMGYFNQFLQFGIDKLINRLIETGIDGLIIPDLPMYHYEKNYKEKFESAGITISFLITPETSDERIKEADRLSTGFLYVVAQSSITGGKKTVSPEQTEYFERIQNMYLNSPKLIGFGIHDNSTFNNACQYAEGAIIGSAFIRDLKQNGTKGIREFVNSIYTMTQ